MRELPTSDDHDEEQGAPPHFPKEALSFHRATKPPTFY